MHLSEMPVLINFINKLLCIVEVTKMIKIWDVYM